MKKLFALVLMLTAMMTMQAQSLTNNLWATSFSGEDDSVIVLSFEDNGTCTVAVVSEERQDDDSGMALVVSVKMTIPGTYTVNGDKLKINADLNGIDTDIDIDIEGADEATKQLILGMVKPELDKSKGEAEKEILNSMPALDSFKIVSITDEQLVLQSETDGETTTFTAVNED